MKPDLFQPPAAVSNASHAAAAEYAKRLAALGALFKIVLPDGFALGDLPIAEDKKPSARQYRIPIGLRARIYKPKLNGLEVGRMIEFKPAEYEGIEAKDMVNAIVSAMSNRFGADNYKVFCADDGVISAVRLA